VTTARRSRVVTATPRLAAKAAAERSARRSRWAKRVGLGLAGTATLALLGWLLLASSLLAVRTVSVTGTHLLTAAQVRAAADVQLGTPLARVDEGAIRRRLARLRPIASVDVTRRWPGTLQVRVVERVAVAGVAERGGFRLVDAGGTAFAPVSALPPGVVRLQVPHAGSTDATTKAALGVLAELRPPMRSRVRIIRAASPSSVTLLLRDGRQVLWGGVGTPQDAALKARAAEVLLKMPGHFYDVSRPDVVTRRD
jgi:cell division protein FtsQ